MFCYDVLVVECYVVSPGSCCTWSYNLWLWEAVFSWRTAALVILALLHMLVSLAALAVTDSTVHNTRMCQTCFGIGFTRVVRVCSETKSLNISTQIFKAEMYFRILYKCSKVASKQLSFYRVHRIVLTYV